MVWNLYAIRVSYDYFTTNFLTETIRCHADQGIRISMKNSRCDLRAPIFRYAQLPR